MIGTRWVAAPSCTLVTVAILLLTVLFLGPALSALANALGALVVFAALRLIDVAEFRRIARFRRSELFLALATTTAVLILDVLYGIAVAAWSILTCCAASPDHTMASWATFRAGRHARHR